MMMEAVGSSETSVTALRNILEDVIFVMRIMQYILGLFCVLQDAECHIAEGRNWKLESRAFWAAFCPGSACVPLCVALACWLSA
jgi:hypothetical protein